MRGIAVEGMPALTGDEVEEAQIVGHLLGVERFPRAAIDRLRDEGADMVAGLQQQLARLDPEAYALHPHAFPALPGMHARVDIQGGEQRVERAGGGVHHEGVIQPFMVDVARLSLDVAVFLVDLRGLGEAGLLLVDRLGDQDPRIVLVQLQQQRRALFHHRNKLLVADPGGVEQDVVAQVTYLVDHLAGVVDGAVVGAELDHRQAERPPLASPLRCHFTHQVAQVVLVKAVCVDAPNKTERVAYGLQVDRRGAGLNQCAVVVRFMIITVEQHQITGR